MKTLRQISDEEQREASYSQPTATVIHCKPTKPEIVIAFLYLLRTAAVALGVLAAVALLWRKAVGL